MALALLMARGMRLDELLAWMVWLGQMIRGYFASVPHRHQSRPEPGYSNGQELKADD